MRLIVNTNTIMSSLIRDSLSRKIFSSPNLKFVTIYFGEKEVMKYKEYIIMKSNITEKQFNRIKGLILENTEILDDKLIQNFMEEVRAIMDHIDKNDTPFIAAALSIKNDGIWTDDKHFEKQTKVKIWKTRELLDYI